MRIAIVFAVTCVVTVAASAADIRQRAYTYTYNAVRDAGSDSEFVICDSGCPGLYILHVRPRLNLAVRVAAGRGDNTGSSPTGSRPAESGPEKKQQGKYSTLVWTVYFRFDDYGIEPEELKKLQTIADKLRDSGKVTVTGYTCDIGSKEYNDLLARKRAESVAEVLRQHGVIVSKIDGKGKCCYLSRKFRRINRRVEIEIEKEGQR